MLGLTPPKEKLEIPEFSTSLLSMSIVRNVPSSGTGSVSKNMWACVRTTFGEEQEPCELTRAKRVVKAKWCQTSRTVCLRGPQRLTITSSARLDTRVSTTYMLGPDESLAVGGAPSRDQRSTALLPEYESINMIFFPPTAA
jgi:hypothetical protein